MVQLMHVSMQVRDNKEENAIEILIRVPYVEGDLKLYDVMGLPEVTIPCMRHAMVDERGSRVYYVIETHELDEKSQDVKSKVYVVEYDKDERDFFVSYLPGSSFEDAVKYYILKRFLQI